MQELEKQIVNACAGMPLALEVAGGRLRETRYLQEWQVCHCNVLNDVWQLPLPIAKHQSVHCCGTANYFYALVTLLAVLLRYSRMLFVNRNMIYFIGPLGTYDTGACAVS